MYYPLLNKRELLECRDLEPHCNHWGRNVGCHGKHRDFMMKRCPKTCNACHPFISAINQNGKYYFMMFDKYLT